MPLKQSTTLGEQPDSYQGAGDLSGSYSLDDIPEEMEVEDGHGNHQPRDPPPRDNEDEQEDLRSSKMHSERDSIQQISESSGKILPPRPADTGQPVSGKAPHPSPASGISELAGASFEEDPHSAHPDLRTLHKGDGSVSETPAVDGR